MPDRRHELEDEDDEPDEVVAITSPLPAVAPPARGWEYRVDAVSVAQAADGAALAERLNQAASDGWDLVDITSGGAESKLVVLRRPRPESREHRPVGFAPRPRPA